MKQLLAALALILTTSLAIAQVDDKDAVEKAARKYSDACGASDVGEMYKNASVELRLLMRAFATIEATGLKISDTDDVDGFVEAVKSVVEHEMDQAVGMGFIVIHFNAIADIEVDGSLARCYVKATVAPRKVIQDGADVDPEDRLLISAKPKPAQTPKPGEKPKPDRKQATHIITLRKEGANWRVSMATPTRSLRDFAPDRMGADVDSPREAASVEDVLETPAGEVLIGDVLKATIKDRKTFGSGGMIDFTGEMTPAFRTFIEGKLGKPLKDPFIDITLSQSGPNEVYLLNAQEPAANSAPGLTDAKLWEYMREFAQKK